MSHVAAEFKSYSSSENNQQNDLEHTQLMTQCLAVRNIQTQRSQFILHTTLKPRSPITKLKHHCDMMDLPSEFHLAQCLDNKAAQNYGQYRLYVTLKAH